MLRPTLIAIVAVFLIAFNSSASSGNSENTVPSAAVISIAQAPITKGATSLALDAGPSAQIGQVAIADVLTYGGSQPTISAPDGWQLIRDDYTETTRQSLYWHAIGGNASDAASWTFSEPVDAQGAILLLNNVALNSPIDKANGNPGSTYSAPGWVADELQPPVGYVSGLMTAKSVTTTSDGDLILAFYATDFGAYRPTACQVCSGLNPTLPRNPSVVVNQESTPLEYWILANDQNQTGPTDDQVSESPQFFNWIAAQVAIKQATP